LEPKGRGKKKQRGPLLLIEYSLREMLSDVRLRNRTRYLQHTELEFLKSLWRLGTDEEGGYRAGPPGYIGWRNSFLGIDSGAPYTFKNTGSGVPIL
jgi:hypothetical protein